MRPLFLDTNAYVSFKRAEPGIMEIIQQAETIGITPIVLGELLAGFDGGNKAINTNPYLALQKYLHVINHIFLLFFFFAD